MGLGEALVPVIWRLRLVGVDRDTFWRFRSALNEDARGAAMVAKGGARLGFNEW